MFQSQDYRLTVAALVLRPVVETSSPYPPVLLQWPAKAALMHEGNLNTVQGGFDPRDPDPLTAIRREIREEYGIRQSTVLPLSHPRFRSAESRKEYVWFLVVCHDPVALVPDPSEVATTAWYYCPQTLAQGVRQMHKGKGRMFTNVFALACEQHPDHFGAYVQFVARQRKRQRQVAERLAHQRHMAVAS